MIMEKAKQKNLDKIHNAQGEDEMFNSSVEKKEMLMTKVLHTFSTCGADCHPKHGHVKAAGHCQSGDCTGEGGLHGGGQ